MLEKLKILNAVFLGGLLVFASWLAVEGCLLLRDSRNLLAQNKAQITDTVKNLNTVSQNINSTSKALEQSSIAVKEVSQEQNKLLTDPKTQEGIALLLRQANNVALTVKKVNVILDHVKEDTLPEVNATLKEANLTLGSANTLLITTDGQIANLGAKAGENLEAIRVLLADPKLALLISNITDTSDSIKDTSKQITITTEDINKRLPELLDELKNISHNTDDSTKEVAKFLQELNKPVSKKTKVFRFILESVIKSSPALLRR